MREINKLLKDPKVNNRFEKYECKYEQERYIWKILISPTKAVEIKHALDSLDKNSSANLRMTRREIEGYFTDTFNVNIFHEHKENSYNNATIHTLSLPRNDTNYYTSDRNLVFCKILISKQWYDEDDLADDIKKRKLNVDYYDNKVWEVSGWDGEEIEY